MSGLKIGSLFSGYCGLDQAVEQVTGATTAWVSDIDKGACKILAHRYPNIPNHGDLTQIDWTAVEPVDIITGGFPCQDLSHAGKRAGLKDGTRSGLWSYMCEAIDVIRPRLVVAENVRGLLSAEALRPVEPCTFCVGDEPDFDMRALGSVLADLADIGYDARWIGLRAADVGAPHGRFRVFLVAYPSGDGRNEGWAESAGLVGGSDAAECSDADGELTRAQVFAGDWGQWPGAGVPLLKTPTSQLAVNGGSQHPDKRRSGGHGPTLADEIEHLLPTPAVNDMGKAYTPEEWDAWTAKMKAAHGNGNGHGKSLEIEAARLPPTPVVTDSTGTRNKTSGRSPSAKPFSLGTTLGDVVYEAAFGQYSAAIARWESVLGRSAPAPTEPTGKGGAHRLSARFCEWMMGLSDGWITDVPGITRNEALKACGNGVVPAQAAAAIRHLLAAAS